MDERLTLSIDCGGLFIKSCVIDDSGTMHSKPNRIETPYPLAPTRFLETVSTIAAGLPPAYRITIGMPGMIRHGVVMSTPHYMTKNGPRTKIDPELQDAWSGFDIQSAVSNKLGLPTRVLNDAEVHGAGIISGSGYEVVITLGTGLGFAIFYGDPYRLTLNFHMRRFVEVQPMTRGLANMSVEDSAILSGLAGFVHW